MTANIVVLDQTLAQYGPEAVSIRNMMRRVVTSMGDRIWRENSSTSGGRGAVRGERRSVISLR